MSALSAARARPVRAQTHTPTPAAHAHVAEQTYVMDAPTDLSAGAAERITPRRTLLSAVDGMASMMSMMPREASRARGGGAAEVLE